jgi:Fe-S-cluster containining protein
MAVSLPALGPTRAASVATCAVECGAKCCRGGMGIYLSADELRRLQTLGGDRVRVRHAPRRPGSSAPWLLSLADHHGRCPFLDDKTDVCSIYEARPVACQRFPTAPTPDCLVWPA